MESKGEIEFNWSVWDKSSVVAWSRYGEAVSVALNFPPIFVSHISSRTVVGVVGSFEEFGSANLLLFSYDGELLRKISAPDLGKDSQFGGIFDKNGKIEVIVGFQGAIGWDELAGNFGIDDGSFYEMHRNY